jgi:hypothetical protein
MLLHIPPKIIHTIWLCQKEADALKTLQSSENLICTLIRAPLGGTSGTGMSKLKTQSLTKGPGLSMLTCLHSLFMAETD